MGSAVPLEAEVVTEKDRKQQGLAFYFGRYATKEWWIGLAKLLVEVSVRELLKAFVDSLTGTVRYYVDKDKGGTDVPITRASQAAAGQVFSTGYTPAREYTRPTTAVTPYTSPGFQGDTPFSGFPRES